MTAAPELPKLVLEAGERARQNLWPNMSHKVAPTVRSSVWPDALRRRRPARPTT